MDKEESFWDTIKTVFYAILIAIVIRTIWFEPFKIPSGSMYPTLYVGDYLFVSKYTYGYSKHSLPWSLPLFEGRIWEDEPERGDVVVFKYPLERGRLFINGEMVEREQVEDFTIRNAYGSAERYRQYIETLPNGKKHRILELSDHEAHDDFKEIVVPQGNYFMMGDNRDRSDDSRVNVGFVPAENLVGKARFLFFSHNEDEEWYKPWSWPKKIRWDRLFDSIS